MVERNKPSPLNGRAVGIGFRAEFNRFAPRGKTNLKSLAEM
jgi:hypothetical protein